MGTARNTKSSPLRQLRPSGISPCPIREAPPILPPLSAWQQHKHTQEAKKSLKRSRESDHVSSRRESVILPPPPNYTITTRQTKSLPPSRTQHVDTESLSPVPCSSQPELSRPTEVEKEDERWTPKRLRSREPRSRNYTELDDTTSDSDSESDSTLLFDTIEDEKQEFDVEAIDGERLAPSIGTHEYWIRWVGYAERTWTKVEDCSCPDSVLEMRRVQGADLVAARRGGRGEEVDVLESLRGLMKEGKENETGGRARGNEKGRGEGQKRNRRSGKSRNGKVRKGRNGRFERVGKRERWREGGDSGEGTGCDSDDDDDVKSEPDLSRHVRANTAWRRLGSVEREESSDLRYITWFRSNPIDVDATILNRVEDRGNVESVAELERIDSPDLEMCGWSVAEDADAGAGADGARDVDIQNEVGMSRELLGGRWDSLGSKSDAESHGTFVLQRNYLAKDNVEAQRAADTDSLESKCTAINISRHLNGDGYLDERSTISKDISDASVCQSIERQAIVGEDDQAVRRKRTQGMDSDSPLERTRRRSATFIKDEQQEAEKLRSRKLEREKKRIFDNATFTSNSASSYPPQPRVILQLRSSGSVRGAVDNAQKLKEAREKEMADTTKRQNGNVLRHELDSSSARFVQEVVKKSRAAAVDREAERDMSFVMQTRRRVLATIEA
ncbi:hypothetical protein VTL71DRAFT_3597 [Oculimacula yallundae]|uniref:Chromo domain-containing protein n=1 Tax=Oculimacula yallundae TaxID=86028 RepID=A0ABR4C8S9_9HELO